MVLVARGPEGYPILSYPCSDELVAHGFGALERQGSRRIMVAAVIGPADDRDRKGRADLEPPSLALDDAACPPTNYGAAASEEHSVADIDQESAAIFYRALRFVGANGGAVVRCICT